MYSEKVLNLQKMMVATSRCDTKYCTSCFICYLFFYVDCNFCNPVSQVIQTILCQNTVKMY